MENIILLSAVVMIIGALLLATYIKGKDDAESLWSHPKDDWTYSRTLSSGIVTRTSYAKINELLEEYYAKNPTVIR